MNLQMRKTITLIALFIATSISITSCSSDDDNGPKNLGITNDNLVDQGPYVYTDFELTNIVDRGTSNDTDAILTNIIKGDWNGALLEFSRSGTGVLDVDNVNLNFTYSIDSNAINLIFANDTLRLQNPELKDNGTLIFDLNFITESTDGIVITYLGKFTYN